MYMFRQIEGLQYCIVEVDCMQKAFCLSPQKPLELILSETRNMEVKRESGNNPKSFNSVGNSLFHFSLSLSSYISPRDENVYLQSFNNEIKIKVGKGGAPLWSFGGRVVCVCLSVYSILFIYLFITYILVYNIQCLNVYFSFHFIFIGRSV